MKPKPYPKEVQRRGFLLLLFCLLIGRYGPDLLVLACAAIIAIPAALLTLDALIWVAQERRRLKDAKRGGWKVSA